MPKKNCSQFEFYKKKLKVKNCFFISLRIIWYGIIPQSKIGKHF